MRACCFRALLLAVALSMGIRAQEKGIEPDWDIRPVLKEIAAHAQRMVPVLEQIVFSIEEGIRKYWNPAVADLLNSQMAENGANRERFQRYILDLAATHEQECAVMDHEAQRCRGMLAKQPNAAPKTEKK